MFTGVSSAKIPCPLSTWRWIASASGSSRAADLPTQPARVERSRSTPSRPNIWLCRYRGKWSAYLFTSTWASSLGPGRPFSIGREGRGAWQIISQHEHAMRGRMMRLTTNRPGTHSSSSVISSPSIFSDPPQALHALPGENLIVVVQMTGQRITAWLALTSGRLIGRLIIGRRCFLRPGDL
jgi:hypothetical protein